MDPVASNVDTPWLTRLSMPGANRDEVCELHAKGQDGSLSVAVAVYPSGQVTFDWPLIEDAANNKEIGPLRFIFQALVAARGA